jgi:hypothetical protein
MRVFRRRKKYGNFRGTLDEAAPLPDIVYQMGAEAAARYVSAQSMSPNPYALINSAEQQAPYGYPQVPIGEGDFSDEIVQNELPEEPPASSPLRFIASALGIGRSKSRERRAYRSDDHFVRAGSPMHFNQGRPGTPVKFRRRPSSPEIVRSRASSPYHFGQQERVPSPLHFSQSQPGSPEVARRLQRAQFSQQLQQLERQQRRQQDLIMINPGQFIPQYQQVQQPYYSLINSNPNIHAYSMIQQPEMYSYY